MFYFFFVYSTNSKTIFRNIFSTYKFCFQAIFLFLFFVSVNFSLFSYFLLLNITFNLPTYHEDVILCLAQVDTYFSVNKVDPQLQLDILRGGILVPLACSVKELITNPPEDLTYNILQAETLKNNIQLEKNCFRSLMETIISG